MQHDTAPCLRAAAQLLRVSSRVPLHHQQLKPVQCSCWQQAGHRSRGQGFAAARLRADCSPRVA